MRRFMIGIAILLLSSGLFAEETITFKGGYTKMSMKDGDREITLSGGATVDSGTMRLTADAITLSGEDYSTLSCSGGVTVIDADKGITVKSPKIEYDRIKETIAIESWVEVEDTTNEISASGGSLNYDIDKGTMEMEGHVRLMRAASKGIMACSSDIMAYDREKKTLRLTGNAVINWQGDTYQAHAINVDLDSEAITMEGAIQGTVHG
jgi:lipopolysaccharide export system protein LptA